MKQTAEEVISDLLKDKNMNLMRGDSDEFSFGRIPFNIPALDNLTGGGIPKKRMTLLYGPTNVGKSYLASQVVANAQRQGGTTAWIDTELSWDSEWVTKCGIDATNVLVAQPTNGEEAMDTARELMRAGVDVIVLDHHQSEVSLPSIASCNICWRSFFMRFCWCVSSSLIS